MKKLLLTTALVAFAGVAHSTETFNGITNTGADSFYNGVDGNFSTGNTTSSSGVANSHGGETDTYQRTQLDVHDNEISLSFTRDVDEFDADWNQVGGEDIDNSLTLNRDGLTIGDPTAGTDLTQYGNSTQYGSTTTHGNLDVGRDATIGDDLTVNGDTTLGEVNEYGEGLNNTTVNGDLTIVNGDGESTNVGNTITNIKDDIGAVETNIRHIDSSSSLTHIDSDLTITGTLTVDGVNVADRLEQIRTTAATAGKQGEQGVQGSQGIQGATGATGAAGRDGADGQDARINVNSAGQYVVSDSSGKSVTVATDEQVTLTKDELTALIESVAATATANLIAESAELTAEIQAENEARIEAIQAEAEERIAALTAAAEERLAIKTLAVSNTVSIVALEDQWKTDPVLGKFELDALTGKTLKIEVKPGVFENKVARVEDIQTIADRVADNTSRIQDLENAVFNQKEAAEDSRVQKLISDLHTKATKARAADAPLYVNTSAGVVDLRGWKGSVNIGGGQILIALDKALAYDVLGLSTVWVALK